MNKLIQIVAYGCLVMGIVMIIDGMLPQNGHLEATQAELARLGYTDVQTFNGDNGMFFRCGRGQRKSHFTAMRQGVPVKGYVCQSRWTDDFAITVTN